MLKKSILDYSDYRTFLLDTFSLNKTENPKFSHRFFAAKADFGSSSTLKLIMEGQRNLSKATVLKLVQVFDFTTIEANYFESLVFYNQAKTLEEKDHYFQKLLELQRNLAPQQIEPDRYSYFSRWYHCVIREAICFESFDGDLQKLSQSLSPKVSIDDVEDSIEMLLKLGFLQKTKTGYEQADPVLTSGNGLNEYRIIQFQIAMLKNAIQSFDLIHRNHRLSSSTTFGISQTTFEHFVRLVRDFRAQLTQMAHADKNPDRVYQLALNLFPLTDVKASHS
jgi:uncharacterized protein (TIGR02147 family)